MDFALKHRSRPDGSVVVAVPPSVRISMAAIAAAIVGSGLIPDEGGALRGLGLPGIAAAALTVLAALYEERWTFDQARRALRFRFGLLFAARTLTIPFEDIEGLGLETFVKGRSAASGSREDAEEAAAHAEAAGGLGLRPLKRLFAPKPYRSLVVYLKSSNRLVVETLPANRAARLAELGILLAELVARPLSES